jgi:transcription factor CP2-like protein
MEVMEDPKMDTCQSSDSRSVAVHQNRGTAGPWSSPTLTNNSRTTTLAQPHPCSAAGAVAVRGFTTASVDPTAEYSTTREDGGLTDELENQVITDNKATTAAKTITASAKNQNINNTNCDISDSQQEQQHFGTDFYIDDEFTASPKRAAPPPCDEDSAISDVTNTEAELEPANKRVKFDEQQVEKLDKPDNQPNNFKSTSLTTAEVEKESCAKKVSATTTTTTIPCIKNPVNLDLENLSKEENAEVEVSNISPTVEEVIQPSVQVNLDKTIVHDSENKQQCGVIPKDNQNDETKKSDSPLPSSPIICPYNSTDNKDPTKNQKSISNNIVSGAHLDKAKVSEKFETVDTKFKNCKKETKLEEDQTTDHLSLVHAADTSELHINQVPSADNRSLIGPDICLPLPDNQQQSCDAPVTIPGSIEQVPDCTVQPLPKPTQPTSPQSCTLSSQPDLSNTFSTCILEQVEPVSPQTVQISSVHPTPSSYSYGPDTTIQAPVAVRSTVHHFEPSGFCKDYLHLVDSKEFVKDYLPLVPVHASKDYLSQDKDFCKEYLTGPEVAVATLDSLRDPGLGVGHAGVLNGPLLGLGGGHGHVGSLALDLIQDGLHNESQEVRVYNGTGDVHQLLSASQIMTATQQAALESVLDCVKTEPEDLTGSTHRNRTDQETVNLPLDVRVRGMGIVTSPEGESIILNPEDLHVAPGFGNTSLASYDNPPFSTYTASETRIYDSPFRDEGLYDTGYRAPANSTYYVSSSTGAPTPGLSVDLPSPDSGIGPDQITPDSFEYTQSILDQNTIRRPWHENYNRANSENEKVQIPKVYSHYGFKYYLDAPTSSSVRKEDDKVTYINKGQFYGVTLEYVRDPEVTLASNTVKSVIMLVFREGKSQEEEIKAWQFWHQRQHSIKQRIIDVDTKNSHGLVGHIEELSHNAIAIYWNPLESFAKVNLAVQCLSTDFSTQKGVKGLPLHIQIDTFEDPRQEVGTPTFHRGYCQVKIFCDKGAERKLRDEERRAAKRRQPVNGKRRMDELYHETYERSDFYSMSDLNMSPTLFTPPEDPDKGSQLCQDFPSFYTRGIEQKPILSNGGDIIPTMHIPGNSTVLAGSGVHSSVLCKLGAGIVLRTSSSDADEFMASETSSESKPKRARIVPPSSERIMIYVRQETEEVYTPLHLVPPTVAGLIASIENKYKISANNIRYIYRKNKDGIVAKIDDDMLRHYCNEDVFLMQVMVTEGPSGDDSMFYDITLSEMQHTMER